MSKRLNVDSAKLPAELKNVIASASAAAAQRSIDLAVTADLDEAIGDVTRGSVLGKFDARVDLARKGLDHIAGSNGVKQTMRQRAQMLAEKKKALEAAGSLRRRRWRSSSPTSAPAVTEALPWGSGGREGGRCRGRGRRARRGRRGERVRERAGRRSSARSPGSAT